jgi:hypothetical protein
VLDEANDRKDRLRWSWKGGAIDRVDFGNPVASAVTRHHLCVYDGSGAAQPLLSAAVAPASSCGTQPCWNATPAGFTYRNKSRQPDGITVVRLMAGPAGRAQIRVEARGPELDTPAPPLRLPVTIQLTIEDGTRTACWQTELARVKRNATGRFRARGS